MCGSKAKIVKINNEYYPACSEFSCLLARIPIAGVDGFTFMKDAIEIWNKRSNSKEIAPKLKPCPFCGNRIIKFHKNGDSYYVYCTSCAAKTFNFPVSVSPEKVAERWNRRVK